jgi:hypothetical protein
MFGDAVERVHATGRIGAIPGAAVTDAGANG